MRTKLEKLSNLAEECGYATKIVKDDELVLATSKEGQELVLWYDPFHAQREEDLFRARCIIAKKRGSISKNDNVLNTMAAKINANICLGRCNVMGSFEMYLDYETFCDGDISAFSLKKIFLHMERNYKLARKRADKIMKREERRQER